MNEEALNRLFILAKNDGYKKSIEEFKVLMSSNEDAINTMYGLAQGDGYRKDINEFKTLVGFNGSVDVKKKTKLYLSLVSLQRSLGNLLRVRLQWNQT